MRFATHKYGRELLVDAARVDRLSGFISDDRAHRLLFYDVTFVTSGSGEVRIDGSDYRVGPRRIVFTAPGQIRQWFLAAPLRGYALFFRPGFLEEFLASSRFLQTLPGFCMGSPQAFTLDRNEFGALVRQVRAAIREIQRANPDSDAVLRGTVYRLLLDLRRRLRRRQSDVATAGARLSHPMVERYLLLLDNEVRAKRTMQQYSALLGVSPGYLSRLTRRHLGMSAQEVAHERLMLEAERMLRFTALTVGQIATQLGFTDAAYFARFFRTRRGESPRAFRSACTR